MFSIHMETFLASIWTPSLRSRLSGDFCFSATNFRHVSRHRSPSQNCQRFPSFVHIRITVITGPASVCIHYLVTWILFYDAASDDCYYLYSYTSCECGCHYLGEKSASRRSRPRRCGNFAALANSLSIHTVHAIPGEGLTITGHWGSVITMLSDRYLKAANTSPNTTTHLPMFSWSAPVPSSQA